MRNFWEFLFVAFEKCFAFVLMLKNILHESLQITKTFLSTTIWCGLTWLALNNRTLSTGSFRSETWVRCERIFQRRTKTLNLFHTSTFPIFFVRWGEKLFRFFVAASRDKTTTVETVYIHYTSHLPSSAVSEEGSCGQAGTSKDRRSGTCSTA